MVDFKGNELQVGDKVVFIHRSITGGAILSEGKIKEIKGNTAYLDRNKRCYNEEVDYHDSWDQVKVKSKSLMKV
jgi:hypothetical protein